MAKPDTYKEADAVKINCVKTYSVNDGTDDPVTYEAGKSYSVSPGSAAHLLRQVFAVHKQPENGKRGAYIGDAHYFVDPKSEAEQKAAEDAVAKDAENKAARSKAKK